MAALKATSQSKLTPGKEVVLLTQQLTAASMADKSKPTEDRPRYVFFFTGPTACGKSTIAKHVADKLNLSFLEGDDVS